MGLKGNFGAASLAACICGLLGMSLQPGWPRTQANAYANPTRKIPTSLEEKTDEYGGLKISLAKAEGFFQARQFGSRWILLDPAGHPFWMRAVYAVDWNDGGVQSSEMLKDKYRGDPMAFARHAVFRLRGWGFNAVGEYGSSYAAPIPTYGRAAGNPEKMPFIRLLNISWYGSFNSGHLAPAPFKTLLAGAVDPQVYQGWNGHIPDVFDPNFAIYARAAAADRSTSDQQTMFTEKSASGGAPNASLSHTPWLLGTTPDDADNLFGFGPGPEMPGKGGVIHPHLGWVVAVTRPEQRQNSEVGIAFGNQRVVRYPDPAVYAKAAWRDYLKTKYKSISSLNDAWGSDYTTFDSDGGWPSGRGLMDESGRGPWIGSDSLRLSSARPSVVADLNAFLQIFANRYFQIVAEAVRAATPNHLVFSPAALDSHGGLSRPEILRAAGRYCDVIQIAANPAAPAQVDKTVEIAHRPLFSWLGIRADQDSAVFAPQPAETVFSSQGERAASYRTAIEWMFSYRTASGERPIVGIDWWEYMDKWGERANWGLVTPRDNAYDGNEDVSAHLRDSQGLPAGGEDRNYGDFLSVVRAVNLQIDDRLQHEIAGLRAATTAARDGSAGKRDP